MINPVGYWWIFSDFHLKPCFTIVRLVQQMCGERYERTINYAMINPSPHMSHGNSMESKNKK